MADRRMYSKKITDSDAFIDMSASCQALYFHLAQAADDDGFNNQITVAMVKAHASADDLKVLLAKNFIIRFDSGVVVIKHWRMHNVLRKDRYTPTNYQEEIAQLGIKENGAYTLDGCQMVAKWLPDGCQMVAPGKVRKGKSNILPNGSSNARAREDTFKQPTTDDVNTYCKEIGVQIDAGGFIDYYTANGWHVGKDKMRDWKAAVRNWARRDAENVGKSSPKGRTVYHDKLSETVDEKQILEDCGI